MSGQQSEPPPPKSRQGLWYLLGALFFCFAAIFIFFYLAHLERTGEAASMNAVVVLLYKLGGKWLVAGVSGAIALLFLVAAIREWTRRRE
jgi:hypothetical protein